MKETRKHNYVVGFSGEGQCAYGKGAYSENIELMTLIQARRSGKGLDATRGTRRRIYKLVPVEEI